MIMSRSALLLSLLCLSCSALILEREGATETSASSEGAMSTLSKEVTSEESSPPSEEEDGGMIVNSTVSLPEHKLMHTTSTEGEDNTQMTDNSGPSTSATKKPEYLLNVPGRKPIETEAVSANPTEEDKTVETTTTTQIPDCPSYVSCPWIYPQPTTDSTADNVGSTSNTEQSTTVEHFRGDTESADKVNNTAFNSESRPSISATQKPGYPSYVPGPWIYPKPIGEGASTKNPETELVNYLGVGSTESESSGMVNSTELESTGMVNGTESESTGMVNGTESSSESRPSISATQKPGYPPYVPGPWIYPKPIGEETSEDSSTKNPETELVNYLGVESTESESSGMVNSTELESTGMVNSTESESTGMVNSTESSTERKPSISATQKPGYPSYVPGPWIYPKPIEPSENSTIVNRIEEANIENGTSRPSVPATPAPECPSYVSCPWIYPQPITESSDSASSTMNLAQNTKDDQLMESQSTSKAENTFASSNSRPSISATQKPGYPSYVPGPWIYPKPIGELPQIPLINKPEESSLVEYLGVVNNETDSIGSSTEQGPIISSTQVGSVISATQEPQHPPYVPGGPWLYPKPAVEISSTTTGIPDCPSYVSCPWIYPQPITDAPPVKNSERTPDKKPSTSTASDQMAFPGPTRRPLKKPVNGPILLYSLGNTAFSPDKFVETLDIEDDLADRIETYVADFFLKNNPDLANLLFRSLTLRLV